MSTSGPSKFGFTSIIIPSPTKPLYILTQLPTAAFYGKSPRNTYDTSCTIRLLKGTVCLENISTTEVHNASTTSPYNHTTHLDQALFWSSTGYPHTHPISADTIPTLHPSIIYPFKQNLIQHPRNSLLTPPPPQHHQQTLPPTAKMPRAKAHRVSPLLQSLHVSEEKNSKRCAQSTTATLLTPRT